MQKSRDAEKTKESIMASATKAFAQEGFDGVSVDAIAKNAGINKAMIYYYYKNKSNLYRIVVENLLEDIYKTILEKNSQYEKPIDKLHSFIETFARYAYSNSYLSKLMLSELGNDGKNLPNDIFLGLKKIFVLLIFILKEGEKRGCFKNTKPIIVHFMIVGAINLFVTTKNLRNAVEFDLGEDVCNSCDVDEVVGYIFDYVVKGIR